MDLVVVDTDVLSFIFKHDSRGAAYKPHLAGKEIIISLQTTGNTSLASMASP